MDSLSESSKNFLLLIAGLSGWERETSPGDAAVFQHWRNTPDDKIPLPQIFFPALFPRKSTNPSAALRRRDAAGARRPLG